MAAGEARHTEIMNGRPGSAASTHTTDGAVVLPKHTRVAAVAYPHYGNRWGSWKHNCRRNSYLASAVAKYWSAQPRKAAAVKTLVP